MARTIIEAPFSELKIARLKCKACGVASEIALSDIQPHTHVVCTCKRELFKPGADIGMIQLGEAYRRLTHVAVPFAIEFQLDVAALPKS